MLTTKCQKNFVVAFTNVVNIKKIDALPTLMELDICTKDNYFMFENDCLIPSSKY